MKTKLEIIDETVEFYSKDTSLRGISDYHGTCVYLTEDGKMCAVGRCMEKPREAHEIFVIDWGATLSCCYNGDTIPENILDSLLKPEYRGHEVRFWMDLQRLHDCSRFWSVNSLSDSGADYVEELKERWKE